MRNTSKTAGDRLMEFARLVQSMRKEQKVAAERGTRSIAAERLARKVDEAIDEVMYVTPSFLELEPVGGDEE